MATHIPYLYIQYFQFKLWPKILIIIDKMLILLITINSTNLYNLLIIHLTKVELDSRSNIIFVLDPK